MVGRFTTCGLGMSLFHDNARLVSVDVDTMWRVYWDMAGSQLHVRVHTPLSRD